MKNKLESMECEVKKKKIGGDEELRKIIEEKQELVDRVEEMRGRCQKSSD